MTSLSPFKVWCIIADDTKITENCAQLLAQEAVPKVNLAKATREEIKLGLEYLINRPTNPLKRVTLATALDKIDQPNRKYWKENLVDITTLGCGITKPKLAIFKEVFYTTPGEPTIPTDRETLNIEAVKQLKEWGKKKDIDGQSKWKKADWVNALAED